MILSGWEAVFFWVFSIAAIFAGLLTVMARNTIHSALFLISSLVSVAALFILLQAEFIAGVQILVYVGGVMVLFLFVIMLVNVGAEERGNEEIFNRPRQVTVSVIFCALLAAGLIYAINEGYKGFQTRDSSALTSAASQRSAARSKPRKCPALVLHESQTIPDASAAVLYRYGSLAFEIASVLLLVAIIGSVMLARTLKQEASVDDVPPDVMDVEAAGDPELATLRVDPVIES